jgi:NAD(P)H-dependent FMN reductase
MITVISGTNRQDSNTAVIAAFCTDYLRQKSVEKVHLLSLDAINGISIHESMYDNGGQDPIISTIQDEMITPAHKWLIISPEYNGSFPGILKLFIDALSARNYKATFAGKKAALLGVASGRAGNLRGMEHLTGLLNYLKVVVMPEKLPVSTVEKVIDKQGNIEGETQAVIKTFLDDFLQF